MLGFEDNIKIQQYLANDRNVVYCRNKRKACSLLNIKQMFVQYMNSWMHLFTWFMSNFQSVQSRYLVNPEPHLAKQESKCGASKSFQREVKKKKPQTESQQLSSHHWQMVALNCISSFSLSLYLKKKTLQNQKLYQNMLLILNEAVPLSTSVWITDCI